MAPDRRAVTMLRSPSGGLVYPENVYGTDDRRAFWPSGYYWHCTGRLFAWSDPSNPWSISSGTGVLVGPRHVITCGHIVPWPEGPWMMLFVPGYYDGASVPGVASYVSDVWGWDTGRGNASAWDMAILRLYDPLGERLGWFGSKTYTSAWQGLPVWSCIGWAGAIAGAERPSWQSRIATIDDDPNGTALEIEHLGDTSQGSSGGPLYGVWADGYPYVIGVHSGAQVMGSEDNNVAAGGRALVDLIIWGHQNWP